MSFLSQNAPSLVPSCQGFWLGSHRVQSWLQGAAGLLLLLLSSGALQAQSGSEQPGETWTARESNRPGQSITSVADGSSWRRFACPYRSRQRRGNALGDQRPAGE
jgi:hypothetical protein